MKENINVITMVLCSLWGQYMEVYIMTCKCNSQEGVILNEELIMLNLDVIDRKEALREISRRLLNQKYVKESFIDAIIKREKDFPTGIQTKSIGVAIPHTDVQYVNKASIAIGVLDKPVIFQNMGSDDRVEVSIIFMLAIKEPEQQLTMLQKLVNVFQDEATLDNIYNANSKLEIIDIMKTFLENEICEC